VRLQVEERLMSPEFRDRVAQARGVLLFVNPDGVREPKCIIEADVALESDDLRDVDEEVATAAGAESRDEDAEDGSEAADPVFRSAACCTAAKLVEVLQFQWDLYTRKPMSVAIVVSAYDLLAGEPYGSDPAKYVRERLALVDQFLRANPERFRYQVFGVSGQGGSYSDHASRGRIASAEVASHRIQVLPAPSTGPHDVTSVVRWLLASPGTM